jgi:bifunctional ADP-heptose synthase (sugar kinase/adenylyltransferase)
MDINTNLQALTRAYGRNTSVSATSARNSVTQTTENNTDALITKVYSVSISSAGRISSEMNFNLQQKSAVANFDRQQTQDLNAKSRELDSEKQQFIREQDRERQAFESRQNLEKINFARENS